MKYRDKPEILAPAGTKEAFIAAIEAGADAIYLGGQFFNARLRAGNFSMEELESAISFAHKRMVKVYITVNTLYNQREIPKVIDYIILLYKIGADAVIIQDLGLGMMVKEIVPNLEMHLSTQGSIYDLDGAKKAYEIGYDRVVTARELTSKELKHICTNFKGEIESFVHGAMCISYSGQCQFSRSIGARSGNRGQCAQPCRLEYKSSDKKGYFLSPSDLQLIDEIDQIVDTQVSSLKIEGRMKSPEYVGTVIGKYRKYLDAFYNEDIVGVSRRDKEELLQIFNRGGFSKAFFSGDESNSYMCKDVPKNKGILIGKVINANAGRNLVEMSLNNDCELVLGDGIEIRGKGFGSNVITYLKDCNRQKSKGTTSTKQYIIGDIKTKVYQGDKIYKVVSKAQQKEASLLFSNKDWENGKFIRKTKVDIHVDLEENPRNTMLSLIADVNKEIFANETIVLDNQSVLDDTTGLQWKNRLHNSLKKTGNTPFALGEVSFSNALEGRTLNISMAQLNAMRRSMYEKLEELVVKNNIPNEKELSLIEMQRDNVISYTTDKFSEIKDNLYKSNLENVLELYFHSKVELEEYKFDKKILKRLNPQKTKIRIVLPLVEIIEVYKDYNTNFREYLISKNESLGDFYKEIGDIGFAGFITAIAKGKEEGFVNNNLECLRELMEKQLSHIYIGNLSWVELMNKNNIKWYADYGFNIYNMYTSLLIEGLGAYGWCRSLETEDEHNNYPLMTVEHKFEHDYIVDRKGQKLEFLRIPNVSKDILRRKEYISSGKLMSYMDSINLIEENTIIKKNILDIRQFSGIEKSEDGSRKLIYRMYM